MRLPLRTKLLYGTSRVGSEALGRSQELWLLYHYAPPGDAHLPTLLPSLAVGAPLAVGGIVGALDESIVGFFSDRTRSPWRRRIPYIVLGAPLWSLFFILLFTPPPDVGNAATAVYLFFVFEALALFGAVVVGPYEALLPELAPTSGERVGLQAVKVYLGVPGTAAGSWGATSSCTTSASAPAADLEATRLQRVDARRRRDVPAARAGGGAAWDPGDGADPRRRRARR